MTTDDIINGIIRREGSKFTNDPLDKGGPTKFGITLRTLRDYHHDDAVSVDEVESLTEGEARVIYKTLYIERPKFDMLTDDRLRAFLVDWGVNSGPRVAIKALQAMLGVPADGIMGSLTAYHANTKMTDEMYDALVEDRREFCKAIVDRDPSQSKWLNGWNNRINEFKRSV